MVLIWCMRGLVVLLLGSMFLSGPSFWGVNHLAYLSWPGRLLVLGLGFLALVPLDREKWSARFFGWNQGLVFASKKGLLVFMLMVAGAFFVCRQRTHFLGDGYLLLDLLRNGGTHRPANAFSFVLKTWLYDMGAPRGISPLAVYQFVSIGAGVLGLGLLVGMLKRIGWAPWRKVLFLYLFLGSGPVLMFCGYVENYALLLAFSICFVVAAMAHARGEVSLLWPAAFLGLAELSHLTAYLFVPAFLVLVWSGRRRRSLSELVAAAVAVVAPVTLVLGYGRMVGFAAVGSGDILRPWVGAEGIFSVQNIVGAANLLLLISPVALIVMIGNLGKVRRKLTDPVQRLLLAMVLPYLGFLLLVNPQLGAARDWDLFAVLGVGLLAWAVDAFPDSRRTALVAIQVTACFAMAWVLVSCGTDAPLKRFEAVAAGFPDYERGYAYEALGTYYRGQHQPMQVMTAYQKAVASAPGSARFHALLGASYMTMFNQTNAQGHPDARYMDKAEASLRRALKLYPNYPFVLKDLALVMVFKKDFQTAEKLLMRRAALKKPDFVSLRALGYCRLQLGRYPEAIATLEKAKAMRSDADTERYLALARERMKNQSGN